MSLLGGFIQATNLVDKNLKKSTTTLDHLKLLSRSRFLQSADTYRKNNIIQQLASFAVANTQLLYNNKFLSFESVLHFQKLLFEKNYVKEYPQLLMCQALLCHFKFTNFSKLTYSDILLIGIFIKFRISM